MKRSTRTNRRAAFTLPEVLVAVACALVVCAAAVSMYSLAFKATSTISQEPESSEDSATREISLAFCSDVSSAMALGGPAVEGDGRSVSIRRLCLDGAKSSSPFPTIVKWYTRADGMFVRSAERADGTALCESIYNLKAITRFSYGCVESGDDETQLVWLENCAVTSAVRAVTMSWGGHTVSARVKSELRRSDDQ